MTDIRHGLLDVLLADCYRRASLDGAHMVRAAGTIEFVRSAAGDQQDLEVAVDAVAGAIATNQDVVLFAALDELRIRLDDAVCEQFRARVRERFQVDADDGWRAWRCAWIRGLWYWTEATWQRFTDAEFPFPGTALDDVAGLRRARRAIDDNRLGDAYDPLCRLSSEPWLPAEERAILLISLGFIETYTLLRLPAGRSLLEEATKLGEAVPLVCLGWAAWWLNQAAGEDSVDKTRDAFERAEREARRAVELNPHFGRAWSTLGRLAEQDYGQSRAEPPEFYFRRAMAEGSFEGWADLLRLELDRAGGSQTGSGVEALLDIARRAWPSREVDAHLQLATLLGQRGRYDEADQHYVRARELDPTRVTVHTERGYARFEAGDAVTAGTMFASAIELAPESYDGWAGMAWLCEQTGQWDEALSHYRRALELRPAWEATLAGRIGECLRHLDRPDEAERVLLAALRHSPGESLLVSGLENLALQLYRERGDVNAAHRIYHDLRAICGADYEATFRNLRGNLAYWFEDYVEAEKEYRRAAEADPGDARLPANVAEALEKRVRAGDRTALPAAVTAMRQATALAPDDAELREQFAWLERQSAMLERYGPVALERTPTTTAVRVELADEFLPHIVQPDGALLPAFLDKIDAMRMRTHERTGIQLPGIRFSTLDEPFPGNVQCWLMGASMYVEHLPVGSRFCPVPLGEVVRLAPDARAADNPSGGPGGVLVSETSVSALMAAGLPVWGVDDYLLGWLDGILRRHLVEFVGHDDVRRRLDVELAAVIEPDLTAVTADVRVRLRRDGSVLNLADISARMAHPVAAFAVR
ncbi:MAG TPA: tetratricopeptide repeat protein [Actinophytocola sp.]|uniref:tetratricopeptide repeat protein n=1 Tax=Actinophytocola sp. TaxID=1872138 RepID=UPI002E060796|nr:tetratricopeptide repeat protein [Actinophytocola sp.]